MERKVIILLLVVIGLFSCKPEAAKQKRTEPQNGKNIVAKPKGAMDDECLRYIEAYRKWINDYVRAVNVYVTDVSRVQSLNEYTRLINEGRKLEMPANCQTDKTFQDTILQITNHAKLQIKDHRGTGIDELLIP